jgi:hypothetical protein
VTPREPAGTPVGWIHGCAVRAMLDPVCFDTGGYLAAVRGIVGGGAAAATPPPEGIHRPVRTLDGRGEPHRSLAKA